jgi:hypothetical protein
LIEAIQLGSFVVLEFGVGPVRLKQAGCEQGAEAEVKLGRIGDNFEAMCFAVSWLCC